MNWIFEVAQFALLIIIMVVLYMTGITWSTYPWHLAGICLCLVLLNIVGYKQGVERGSTIAREACTDVINQMFGIAKKL